MDPISYFHEQINKKDLNHMKRVFDDVDEHNKGFLDQSDIKVAVLMLVGHKPSKSEVQQILASYGSEQKSGEQGLTLIKFIEVMKIKLSAIDQDEQIRSTFLAFDHKCRGFLTLPDVQSVFNQVCPNFPGHQVELAFKEMDRDADGRVSFKDFDFMMKFDNL